MDGPGFDQFAVIGECFSLTSGLFLVLKWIVKVTSSVNGEIWSDLDTAFGGVFTEGLGFTRHESLSSMEKPPHRDGLNEKNIVYRFTIRSIATRNGTHSHAGRTHRHRMNRESDAHTPYSGYRWCSHNGLAS